MSGEVNEMRSALKDITMTENKMVVAVKKKKLQNRVKTWNAECAVSQNVTKRAVERYFELELILRV